MDSLWMEQCEIPKFSVLTEDVDTDVLVIGGGAAGILTAYFLNQAGVKCRLVEARNILSGMTQNTTAKITSQHGFIYSKLLKMFGEERAKMYYDANQQSLRQFSKMAQGIDCDFEVKNNYVYSLDEHRTLYDELAALMKLNISFDYEENLPLPFSTDGAICFADQAQFHPMKFFISIARGLPVYENTFVQKLVFPDRTERHFTALTDKGKIHAEKVIVATHFPFLNSHGSHFLKMFQHRSYVLALSDAPDFDGMYIDASGYGLSLRNYKEYLLLGGGAHRTGKKGGNYTELACMANKYFPSAVERYRWAAQDCMTLDHIPYIGQYSRHTRNLYVATGFNKWGMTGSMTAAMLLKDLILEKENEYTALFSPSRSILRPQLAVNAAEAVSNLMTFSTKRCPHMGCALKWNPSEHSWDCPCHGSRFTEEGRIINNPAMRDMNL